MSELSNVMLENPFAEDRPYEIVGDYVIDAETGEIEDAEIATLTMRLQAITEQITAMKRDHENKRKFLESWFGSDLRSFAERQLADGKAKTLKTPFGSLYFRKSQGAIKIIDNERALAWCQEHAPEAVKVTPSVLITPLKERDDLPAGVFEVHEPENRFYIDTKIKGGHDH